jgi:c-di-GMP-binding flagellar brake protein YcgR
MADSTVPVEAELTLFRPRMNKVPRRTAERYRCALASAGKLFFPATGETMTAWLNNLSTTGVGMNLPRALEAGMELIIQVRVDGGAGAVRFPARVVHSTLEVDGSWRVGCNFDTPLSAEVLESLL